MLNPSNPDWYEALQGEPLRSKTFSRELSAKIRAEAMQPANSRRSIFRRISALSAIAVCVVGGFILMNTQGLLQKDAHLGSSTDSVMSSGGAPQATEPNIAGPEVNLPAAEEPALVDPSIVDPASSFNDLQTTEAPTLNIVTPTDEEWQTLINDSYPSFTPEMLYKESIGDNRVLIFSKKVKQGANYPVVYTVTDEFEWTESGWRRLSRYTMTNLMDLQEPILISSYGPFLTTNDPRTRVRIYSGLVIDPNITSVQLKSDDGNIHGAQILPSDDGHTYFFIALPPGALGRYTLEAIGADEQLIHSEIFY